MAWQEFKEPGKLGIFKDVAPAEMIDGAWSDGANVRFLDSSIEKSRGYYPVYGDMPTDFTPRGLIQANVSGSWYWLVIGYYKVYAVTSGPTWTNVTRQTAGVDVDYANLANTVTNINFSGIPIFNPGNTSDPPQMWNPVSVATKMQALSNWPASTYCGSLRAFKNFLIALNVTKGANNYPYMMKWSHPADPGSVPSSWDETDATKQAGEIEGALAETPDKIVDGLSLGDRFIIYKERSTYVVTFVGGNSIFNIQKLFKDVGILYRNCVCEFGDKHLVVTNDDIVVHDGATKSSIVDGAWRRWFFENLDVTYGSRTHVVHHKWLNEVWILFPSVGSTRCDTALIYNYASGAISKRDVDQVNCASAGYVGESSDIIWGSDTGTWADDVGQWNSSDYPPQASRLLLGSMSGVFSMDVGYQDNGANYTSFIERRGLALGDDSTVKLVRSIKPRISGEDGAEVTISVAGTFDPDEEPVYTDMTYIIGTTTHVDCLVEGKYLAIKFSDSGSAKWRLNGFRMDIVPSGAW